MRLLTLPTAQHLFARALAVSPADAAPTSAQAEEAARAVARSLGVSADVAGMSSVDELALFRALNAAVPAVDDPLEGLLLRSAQPLPFAPVIDGDVVPHSVTDGVLAGVGGDKPVLIGSTAHEFNESLTGATTGSPQADAASLLQHAGASRSLAHTMVAREPQRGADWALGQAVSDAIFRAPVAGWAALRGEGPTWAYDFRWESRAPGVQGAAHCVDVPFGFDILGAEGVALAVGEDPPQALADSVHRDWLGLVRDGAPDAPAHAIDHAVIQYGADGRRAAVTGYGVERQVWSEALGRPLSA